MTNRMVTIPVFQGATAQLTIEVSGLLVPTTRNDPPPNHGMFRIMGANGDDRLTWFKGSLAQISAARKAFRKFVQQGLKPHKIGKGEKPIPITEFDPNLEEILFLPKPAVAGG